ncbi:MAG: hypothetical protein OXM61_16610 [Candidatus Poribacteria bacterium]|nr:hypothetical protein [Candidatus Poribacteria bacterium]
MHEQDAVKTATFATIRESGLTLEQVIAIRMICANPHLADEYVMNFIEEAANATKQEPPQVDPASE